MLFHFITAMTILFNMCDSLSESLLMTLEYPMVIRSKLSFKGKLFKIKTKKTKN